MRRRVTRRQELGRACGRAVGDASPLPAVLVELDVRDVARSSDTGGIPRLVGSAEIEERAVGMGTRAFHVCSVPSFSGGMTRHDRGGF